MVWMKLQEHGDREASALGRHVAPTPTLQHWGVWEGLVPGEVSMADQHWGDQCHFHDLASILSSETRLQKAFRAGEF